jgi:hypothetical protein
MSKKKDDKEETRPLFIIEAADDLNDKDYNAVKVYVSDDIPKAVLAGILNSISQMLLQESEAEKKPGMKMIKPQGDA